MPLDERTAPPHRTERGPVRRPTPRVATWLLAGAALASCALLFRRWRPATDAASSLCLSRRLFHLPCPGCGFTRSFLNLARGDWAAAFALHPLAPFVAFEVLVGWVVWGLVLAGWRARPSPPLLDALLWGHAAALVALWLGRTASGTLPW